MIKDGNKQYYIYMLTEPGVNNIGYIGQTDNMKIRLRKHISDAKLEKKKYNKNCSWIRKMLSAGKVPVMSMIDKCLAKDADNLEIYYIHLYKNIGWKLTNSTNGGQNGFIYTKERLAQIRTKATKLRTIYGINIKTKEVGIYESAIDAQIKLNLTYSDRMALLECCEHRRYQKSVKGYIFVYEKEFMESDINNLLSYSPIYKFSKAVLKYDLDGNFISEFKNKHDASRDVNGSPRMIKEYCVGSPRHKSYKGFQWRWKDSDDFPLNIGKSMNMSHNQYKSIEQLDIHGNIINSFKSLKEASKNTGCDYVGIVSCCNGKQRTCGNFIWRRA